MTSFFYQKMHCNVFNTAKKERKAKQTNKKKKKKQQQKSMLVKDVHISPVTEQLHQAAGTFRLREMDAPQEIPPDHPYAGSSYEQSEIPILSEREREYICLHTCQCVCACVYVCVCVDISLVTDEKLLTQNVMLSEKHKNVFTFFSIHSFIV